MANQREAIEICLPYQRARKHVAGCPTDRLSSLPRSLLGFQDLATFADVHLDLLGLGFSALAQPDLQDAVVIVGAHVFRVHGVGQGERAGEAAIAALYPAEV